MENNKCLMEQFTDILKNNPDNAYDFICNNYYKFSKDELGDIAKELLYGIHYESQFGLITKADHNKILMNAAEELDERYEEEYEEYRKS